MLIPKANVLLLVGQLGWSCSLKIKCCNFARCWPKEILCTTRRGSKVALTSNLSDLKCRWIDQCLPSEQSWSAPRKSWNSQYSMQMKCASKFKGFSNHFIASCSSNFKSLGNTGIDNVTQSLKNLKGQKIILLGIYSFFGNYIDHVQIIQFDN